MSQSPLQRGRSSAVDRCVALGELAGGSQSPLQRGRSSASRCSHGCWRIAYRLNPLFNGEGLRRSPIRSPNGARPRSLVSIPSSTGKVFGVNRKKLSTWAAEQGLNPLFNGEGLRRDRLTKELKHAASVSIPSSTGKVFGADAAQYLGCTTGGLNPLFNGEGLRRRQSLTDSAQT